MYLSYAKDLAVALIETKGFEQKVFDDLLDAVAEGGDKLFNHRVNPPEEENIKDMVQTDFPKLEDL